MGYFKGMFVYKYEINIKVLIPNSLIEHTINCSVLKVFTSYWSVVTIVSNTTLNIAHYRISNSKKQRQGAKIEDFQK